MTLSDHPKNQSPNLSEAILRLAVLLALVAMLFWLSLTSSPPQLPSVLGWDKLLHAGAYGVLTLVIARFLYCLCIDHRHIWWASWLSAVSFGALMEALQLLVHTGRAAEWQDLCADAIGAFLSCVIFRQFPHLVCSRHELRGKDHE